MQLKLVKVDGEFVWHPDTDEFFLVHSGRLTIELPEERHVTLEPGEFYVVPKGVRHRPVADGPCEILLLEPAGVVNTGDASDSEATSPDEWI